MGWKQGRGDRHGDRDMDEDRHGDTGPGMGTWTGMGTDKQTWGLGRGHEGMDWDRHRLGFTGTSGHGWGQAWGHRDILGTITGGHTDMARDTHV